MGLKDLKSNLDLLGGFGQEGETLEAMENFSPINFQRGTDAASQAHVDSLLQVPGGDSNSPFQDIDGEQPPPFQRELDVADQAHKSSLGLVPGGDSNSPFQDLDGEQGPQFQKGTTAASQAHIDSLQRDVRTEQDLNGELGPQFQKETDIASQVHLSSLAVVPGGDSSSPFQDRGDGATPPQYLNDLPN